MATRFFLTLSLLMAISGCKSGDGSGSEAATSTLPDYTINSCEAQACGGDPVGLWELYTYCTTDPAVVGYSKRGDFYADHTYCTDHGCGTWETDGNYILLTYGTKTTRNPYCVTKDSFWWGSPLNAVVRHRVGVALPTPGPAENCSDTLCECSSCGSNQATKSCVAAITGTCGFRTTCDSYCNRAGAGCDPNIPWEPCN